MHVPTAGPPVAIEKPSLIEDCIDIWFTPSAVFARRSDGGWLGPFVVCLVLLTALFYAAMGPLQGVFDAELMRSIADARAQNPNLTGDQLAAMQGVMEKTIRFGGLIFLPIVLFLLGVCVWLAAKILGGNLSFGGGLMVASFAYLPKALELLLVTVQGLVMDTSTWNGRYQFSWGAARFMEPSASQGVYNLLGRVDVFTIWVTILIAMGLVHAAKLENAKAYAGAAAIWVLGATPALFQLVTGK
jgi:hypothetical protein